MIMLVGGLVPDLIALVSLLSLAEAHGPFEGFAVQGRAPVPRNKIVKTRVLASVSLEEQSEWTMVLGQSKPLGDVWANRAHAANRPNDLSPLVGFELECRFLIVR